jgi:ectoine hydroxylase-related dioxygenase (phytanoyl-CoA dioxygenase family)
MKPMPPELLNAFKITPGQLAGMFWGLDDSQQAEFFHELGNLAITTPAPFTREIGSWFAFDWQMYHAAAHAKSSAIGRRAMEIIGESASGTLLVPYEREDVRYRNLWTRGGVA